MNLHAIFPNITGRTKEQFVQMLLDCKVPAEFWPRTLGRPVEVDSGGPYFWIAKSSASHPEIIYLSTVGNTSGFLVTNIS